MGEKIIDHHNVERELVYVAAPKTEGNDTGYRVTYRDQMTKDDKELKEPPKVAEKPQGAPEGQAGTQPQGQAQTGAGGASQPQGGEGQAGWTQGQAQQ